MAKSDNDNWTSPQFTSGGITGTRQNLADGLQYDSDGNVVVPEVDVPDGTTIVQQDQIGAFRRTVFSNGQVETIQTKAANQGPQGTVATPVALPGEQQDVTGTGMDEATQPKIAPDSKQGKAAEKLNK